MGTRKKLKPATETGVLLASKRRCALCFGLNGDVTEKKGQIAHIDQNNENADENNLVFLCLEHHDEYDSTTRQAKGITSEELREYKRRLSFFLLTEKPVITPSDTSKGNPSVRKHDTGIFKKTDAIMSETFLRNFLGNLGGDHAFHFESMDRVDEFYEFHSNVGNQFIDEKVSFQLKKLMKAIGELREFTGVNFFAEPRIGKDKCYLQPELCVDRGGAVTEENMQKYQDYVDKLLIHTNEVYEAYAEYRRTIKTILFV